MNRVIAAVITAAACFGAAAATASDRVQTRDAFVSLVDGRSLTSLGVTLNVSPDGQITGRAFGQPVRGGWRWDGGFFCRELWFGERALGPNCQVVEKRGSALRFTADKGAGDHADLRIR